MKKTIRTVWSTYLVIHISVKLFGSTLLVLIVIQTVCQGYIADDKSHRERQFDQRLCYSHQSGFYEDITRVLSYLAY